MTEKNTFIKDFLDRDSAPGQSRTDSQALPGWKSPSYTESSGMTLDQDRLAGARCIGMIPDHPMTQYYKILKTQLYQRLKARSWNTVMITSARRGEGKTVTAINMSFAFAQDFSHTVMLIDCDLKHQRVHEYLGVPVSKGIADHLVYDTPLKDLIVWPGVPKFTFISGGSLVTDSTEILNSSRMGELIT